MFLLVFPKGGIKISGIPLTWGYFFLFLVSLGSLFQSHLSIHTHRLTIYCFTIPFQLIAILGMWIHGVEGGFGISFIFNFFFLPWCFFILLSKQIDTIDIPYFFKLFKIGVFVISIYGVFLFAFKLFTGKFIEIPFLTVNFHDFGEIESKHINRGSVFKLISTYNNGNIYGICLLMILPLYSFLEDRKWRKIIVLCSLMLTLSRTVWIGLIFSELITHLTDRKMSFPQWIMGVCMVLFGIIVVVFSFGFDLSFLFDANLGGRKEQLSVLHDMTFFPRNTFVSIGEMAYLSILANFGMIGLLTFIICMSGPLIIGLSFKSLTLPQKRILCGLVTYLFVALSDAAILFVPVMAFFWFLSALVGSVQWGQYRQGTAFRETLTERFLKF